MDGYLIKTDILYGQISHTGIKCNGGSTRDTTSLHKARKSKRKSMNINEEAKWM